MKGFIDRLVVFLFWLTLIFITAKIAKVTNILEAKPVDFSVLSSSVWMDGKNISIVDTVKSNEVVLLQFWASWCVGCEDNMRILSRLEDELSKKGYKVGFFPISIDENIEAAKAFYKVRDNNLMVSTYPKAIFDVDSKFSEHMGITSIPWLAVVTADGEKKKTFEGHISQAIYKDITDVIISSIEIKK